ncbi:MULTISPECIES: helix-turn-helix domain-containing protein [Leuconostoc]|jgi:transcriptional regulator with XRE-family HTH domain|uniref:helix-turn-helix domain-containing protein n=1 Tax=Leuconostoc TaxID=1243 RepID=UPI0020744C25|nr:MULTISPECIES: helix-turn-helix domain-containing protein [Leuconostoc]MCH3979742.1 helix-turn-helix domain-containing protein [Leuconostoc mesenteroides]MCH3979782.1 helix-turn-helix domain-containing protein [Leuconostoc mesenteroides]MCH3980022.1 helix-turn-helix domain-containing protein [Leuconostoc mesenteroides]MCM6832378.1 helix-turn-helix domain-containing protein [Leuconostoc mesenteroides]MDI6552074.1 helix-turn-helix domain-containing protein [Leuconostoc suionicum]
MEETLLDRIKYLAKEKELSLSQIEKDANLAKTSIYTWKNKTPNAKNLEKVANILDTNTDYLLGRSNDPSPIDEEDDPSMFFRIDMRNVPEEDRDEFKAQLKLLKDFAFKQIEEARKEQGKEEKDQK